MQNGHQVALGGGEGGGVDSGGKVQEKHLPALQPVGGSRQNRYFQEAEPDVFFSLCLP